MISLSAKTREKIGKKISSLRGMGKIPAVVYGHNVKKNDLISVDEKEFKKVFKEAGESSLIEIQLDDAVEKRTVLVHDIQADPISGGVLHIDFFQPNLNEKVEVAIPLIFEGVAPAEKDLGGTLSKNFQEVQVEALPQDLPHEIVVNISTLVTFENHILVKDLEISEKVKILKDPDETVAAVLPPQDVEAELAKEITGDVTEVEKIEKEKKEDEEIIEEPDGQKPKEESKQDKQ